MNEIDKLIATRIMKWSYSHSIGVPSNIDVYKDKDGKRHENFKPSINIQDAWLALDKLCKEHNWRAIIDRNQTDTQVNFKTHMGQDAQLLGYRETPTLAICDILLDYLGIKLDDLTGATP